MATIHFYLSLSHAYLFNQFINQFVNINEVGKFNNYELFKKHKMIVLT